MKPVFKLFVLITLFIATIQSAFSQGLNSNKQKFVTKLTGLSEKVNDRILKNRARLLQLKKLAPNSLSSEDKAWLKQIVKNYKVKNFDINNQSDWVVLLKRVDIIPASLVIAQAAIESAWGTSRFAKVGNNYFGQWCFRQGCGIVPLRRPAGHTYEVQKFQDPTGSINAYVFNLNTNPTYRSLRNKRASLRKASEPVTGYALASGLDRYSQLGEKYVGIVRRVIKHYDLNQYTA